MPDFQQTVDLKEKFNNDKLNRVMPPEKKRIVKQPVPEQRKIERQEQKRSEEKAQSIDEVYRDDETAVKSDLRVFHRPAARRATDSFYKYLSITLAIALVCATAYFMFFKKAPEQSVIADPRTDSGWYAVELVNKQVYYGQVDDKSADPLVVRNVYYNYDQLSKEGEASGEGGSLRLVKRGKETHGPDGSMDIIRSQVVFIEPLKEDSKVLKAILDYEK